MLSLLLLMTVAPLAQEQAAAAPVDAHYTFEFADPQRQEVHARLELSGFASNADAIQLSFPQGFAFAQLPEPRLTGEVHLAEGQTSTLVRDSAYQWTLQPKDQSVVLHWTVPLDHRSQPEVAGRDEYEYPYLDSDHGMLVMGTLVLAPSRLGQIRVQFQAPSGWPVVAPWPKHAQGGFAPPDLGSLNDDLIAVGEWKYHQQQVRGMNLTLAFSPQQQALFDQVVAQTPSIIEAELELFGCTPQQDYLFLFGKPQSGGAGGSPKANSMTLFVDPELPPEFAGPFVSHLIAHEFHHTWMRARCQPVDELRYVIEGFTDYYSYLVPWRLGMNSNEELLQTFADKFAEAEIALLALPQNSKASDSGPSATTLAEAGGPAFFAGGAAHDAVYSGGLILALWLDLTLRQSGKTTLDQLMRDFYEDPRWQDGTRPNEDHFWALVAKHDAEAAEIGRALTTNAGFDGWQQAFLRCGIPTKREVVPAPLEVRANFDGTRIAGIDPAGTGAMIGLMDGDLLIQVNGVKAKDASTIRVAFAKPVDGKIEVSFKREGKKQRIQTPIPLKTKYSLNSSLLDQLQSQQLDLAAPAKSADAIRVMQFNIWQEGTSVKGGFEMIADLIAASNADLVALSEVRNYNDKDFHQRLLAALQLRGCHYYAKYAGGDVGLLSRWPIEKAEPVADETASDHGSVMAYHLRHPNGSKVIFCTAHLDYLNYATYLPRGYDGNSFKMIDPDGDGKPNPVTDLREIHAMDAASKRDESIESFLRYAKKAAGKKATVFLVGDFNECSHLDWTAATKDLWSHNGVIIDWKNSKRLSKAGFIDAWRELFPNPVTHPGATWPSPAFGREKTTWTPKADERDRIDFVYSNQRGVKPVAAWIVGPQSYSLFDRVEPCTTSDPFALTDHPWPSDHKGILVDFKVE